MEPSTPGSPKRFSLTNVEMNTKTAARFLRQLSIRSPDLDDWEFLRRSKESDRIFFFRTAAHAGPSINDTQ